MPRLPRGIIIMIINFIGGKLAWNWGGPYEIVEETKRGTYRLKNKQGKVLKTAVNSNRLKHHYEGISLPIGNDM